MTSSVTDLVSALYGSANEISKLSIIERRHLIERAARATKEQRAQLMMTGKVLSMSSGIVAGLETVLPHIDDMPDQLISHILFELADEIRKQHILVSSIA